MSAGARAIEHGPRRSPRLEAVLDGSVRAFELRQATGLEVLYPEERRLVARAVEKRKLEFAAGRACAREAISALGGAAGPLTAVTGRGVAWPDGFVGSITHTRDFCGAAVARRSQVLSLGVDAEVVGDVAQVAAELILTACEQRRLAVCSHAQRQAAIAVIFSAKEAFYKCQAPLTGRWIDFLEVEIELIWGEGAFRVSGPDHLTLEGRCHGRFRCEAGLVFTGAWLPV